LALKTESLASVRESLRVNMFEALNKEMGGEEIERAEEDAEAAKVRSQSQMEYDEEIETIHTYEQAFKKIAAKTGSTDTEWVVDQFIESEHRNFRYARALTSTPYHGGRN
jgi:hypothetical protein